MVLMRSSCIALSSELKTKQRNTFEMGGSFLLPKPLPVCEMQRELELGFFEMERRYLMIVAPVGVTRSPWIPSSMTGIPCIRIAVAGAGIGNTPCAVLIVPPPRGRAENVQSILPTASIKWAATQKSIIESQAPTS